MTSNVEDADPVAEQPRKRAAHLAASMAALRDIAMEARKVIGMVQAFTGSGHGCGADLLRPAEVHRALLRDAVKISLQAVVMCCEHVPQNSTSRRAAGQERSADGAPAAGWLDRAGGHHRPGGHPRP